MGVNTDDSARLAERAPQELCEYVHMLTPGIIMSEPFREFIDLNEWHIQEIEAALKDADAGDFARPSEVDSVLKKWSRPPNVSSSR